MMQVLSLKKRKKVPISKIKIFLKYLKKKTNLLLCLTKRKNQLLPPLIKSMKKQKIKILYLHSNKTQRKEVEVPLYRAQRMKKQKIQTHLSKKIKNRRIKISLSFPKMKIKVQAYHSLLMWIKMKVLKK